MREGSQPSISGERIVRCRNCQNVMWVTDEEPVPGTEAEPGEVQKVYECPGCGTVKIQIEEGDEIVTGTEVWVEPVRWALKTDGKDRCFFTTREAAIKAGRVIKSREGGDLIIHDETGAVESVEPEDPKMGEKPFMQISPFEDY